MHSPCATGDAHRDNLRQHYETIEQRRRCTLIYVGNGVAGVFLFGFGLMALHTGHRELGWFTLAHCLIIVGNILLFRLTHNKNWADYGFIYGILAVFTYLTASGGIENTGPLWGYPMIAATITVIGGRRGLAVVTAMYCIALALFWMPLPFEVEHYSTNFKVRYLATFAATVLFTALHEYTNLSTQRALLDVSEQFDRLSQIDPLTGLPNRRHMREQLEAEASRQMRHGHPYSILFGDIDDFKTINDRYGHHAGDAALQEVSRALRTHLRQHDAVSRWGGEEFLLLLPETDATLALEVAEKLRMEVAALDFRVNGQRLPLTMSFGVHTAETHGRIDSFIDRADQNLYQAKRNGKNQVVAGAGLAT